MSSVLQQHLEATLGAATDEGGHVVVEGSRIGRYVVLRRLDGGGMGIVYLAYDPELDRQVAVKVVRPARERGRSQERARIRLLREAQALARLSHGNVVAIHDVGTHDDAIFLAMEFIEGVTLDKWLSMAPRTWREILDVLVEAGRGLQAAHDAGIVHRDFKPQNVMVEPSGTARVLDFGLARTNEDAVAPSSMGDGVPQLVAISVSDPITVAGALVGTPAYMAPEQFAGVECDARTDQFAFCVAAWRALFRQRPFEGDNAYALSASVIAGDLIEPRDDRGVPGFVRRALRRGMSAERDDRFESIAALLGALTRPRGSRVRPGLVFAGLGVGLVAATALATAGPDVCEDGQARLAGVWDADTREEIEARFSEVPPFGPAAWTRVEEGLDGWTRSWVDAYANACAATRVHATQSEEVLDRRMSCLDERRQSLYALVDVLRAADLDTVERSLDAVQRLPGVDVCADVDYLEARVRPPADSDVTHEVEELRRSLANIVALSAAGKDVQAHAAVIPLLVRAHEVGYEPLTAEVEGWAGRLEGEVGDTDEAVRLQRSAYFRARAVGHDEVARDAAVGLVTAEGMQRYDLAGAEEWAAHARAELARSPSPHVQVELEAALAGSYRFAGRYEDAVPHAQRALELSGEDEVARARALLSLASALAHAGRRAEARPLYEESLALDERVYGPDHPNTADVAHNLASTLATWGHSDEARPFAERAVEVWQRSRPGSATLVKGLTTLGLIEIRLGEHDDGIATLDRALRIASEVEGPGHPLVGKIHGNLGLARWDRGDFREAVEHFTLARDIFVEANGPTHPLVGMAESNLGMTYAELGELDSAVAHYERGIELLEPAFGEQDARLRDPIESLARIERWRDHPARAAYWDDRADRLPLEDAEL